MQVAMSGAMGPSKNLLAASIAVRVVGEGGGWAVSVLACIGMPDQCKGKAVAGVGGEGWDERARRGKLSA